MKLVISFLVAILVIYRSHAFSNLPPEYLEFLKYLDEYNIKYDTEEEQELRYVIFKDNLKKIEILNKKYSPHTRFGMNQFTVLTYEEFAKFYLMENRYINHTGKPYKKLSTDAIPEEVDWRAKKVVSHIKNQGQCGSCWTFAVTAALESHLAIKTQKHQLFSEQQLLDCVTNNYGCTGGYLDTAYQYMGWYGQVNENAYPYTAKQGTCNIPNGERQKIQGYYDIVGGETNLASFIAEKGPASFSIMCPKELMHYKSGIFSVPDCKGTMVGWHAMAIVGYTKDYWIIKNSWSNKWGEKGYVRFKRGIDLCELGDGAGGPILI